MEDFFVEDKDIEIDLLDLWNALKKNAKVIAGVTACFELQQQFIVILS